MSNELRVVLKVFEEIKATPSRLKKDEVMRLLLKNKPATKLMKEILIYTYHPYWNYWVTSKKLKNTSSYQEICNRHWNIFKVCLNLLKNRQKTGDAAIDEVTFLFDSIPNKLSRWFKQILDRDIKIGYKLKSFEKHLGQLVPRFTPMLAATWDKKEIKEEVAIEEKLDGLRCITIFPEKGEPTTVSRNGRPIYNTEQILKEMKYFERSDLVIDGELGGSEKSWGSGISGAHSKNKKVDGLQYVVFDIIALSDWEKRKCNTIWKLRRSSLKSWFHPTKHVSLSEARVGKFSAKKIKSISTKIQSRGGEGIIIKRTRGTYDFKRSDNWLKDKFKRTDDFYIEGAIEGKHKNKGSLGAVIVIGKVDGVKIKSEVGQGFSDEMRKKLWKMHKQKMLFGLIIEVEHYGTTAALRLKKDRDKRPAIRNGVFLRIREDKQER